MLDRFKSINIAGTSLLYLFLFSVIVCSSCKNEQAEKQIHSLDSLSGALNQKLAELKTTDTLTLEKAIGRFKEYKKFIGQNITDTISKQEADILQQFYKSGESLISFSENRKAIIGRGNLIASQLEKMIADAKQNSITEDFHLHFEKERAQAEIVIHHSVKQQSVYFENLQEFRLSLNGVEALIKSRNNGQMPVVIRDTIPF